MPMTAGALIYRMRQHLPGWRLALVVAFIPMSDGIANGAAAWPVWTALNLDASLWVTHFAWLVTLGLALTYVWVLSFVVARPRRGGVHQVEGRHSQGGGIRGAGDTVKAREPATA